MSMRKIVMLAVGASLLFAAAAGAQQSKPAPAQPAAPQGQSQPPEVRSINVVDMAQLPKETQARVNEAIAARSDADLQKLRGSIDARPDIKSALQEKGLDSGAVIAASLAENGTLTLITQKKPG